MHEQGSAYCAWVRGAMGDGQCREVDIITNCTVGIPLAISDGLSISHNNDKNSNIVYHLQL